MDFSYSIRRNELWNPHRVFPCLPCLRAGTGRPEGEGLMNEYLSGI